ncbi:MAG: peptidoglycan-binding protein [Ruminococcaceae bacterium]|nr:peptidoglycan-binding protein [Oscillospiraceae bacterium]
MQNANNFQDGFLRVSVYDQTEGRPLNNITVSISEPGEDGQVIENLVTNSSGNTETINLGAPDIAYSLEPAPRIRPYSEYDITVNADGFEPFRVEGVQILPEALALQNIFLTRRQTNVPIENDIFILPHTLWETFPPKIPEDAVKELPTGEGLVVLPEPVVPEFIIVHDGVPSNSSAQNYYVPFKDYIKNVASCEIYSTWPVETIEANVLAIISFTLNRVYTEWYRGRGYDFTITNSTAYDQAFVYGRNIFSEISEIVDYLFTTYITKPNIRQPLFAQYCNGSNVTCPGWLSQWGSKELGDRGFDAVEILRQYYGSDIYLAAAETVSGVPSSYPGFDLQVGSEGNYVRTIQEQLNAISDNYPAIQKLRVDGIYGPLTEEAVRTFQEIFDLPVSGVVDFGTWYQISNIFVAVERLASGT